MIPDGYDLRELTLEDAPAIAAAYRRNRDYLAPWEPLRSEEFYTDAGQEAVVVAQLGSAARGLSALWVLWSGDQVAGRVNLNTIVRGAFHSATVGYWVDPEHQRRGLASAMVERVAERARELGLHRLEAGTLVHNEVSQRVLEKAGFERYGLAQQYLCIAGAWQDHVLFQKILHDEPLAPRP